MSQQAHAGDMKSSNRHKVTLLLDRLECYGMTRFTSTLYQEHGSCQNLAPQDKMIAWLLQHSAQPACPFYNTLTVIAINLLTESGRICLQ